MSSSGGEEDFQSADEDIYDDEEVDIKHEPKQKPSVGESKSHSTENVSDENKEFEKDNLTTIKNKGQDKSDRSSKKVSDPNSGGTEVAVGQNTNDDGDDDDQEALAERIRERNLRIARKFSAELAKSVKSSAPIPVSVNTSADIKTTDSESTNIPRTKSKLPPAPPPTPALSSSFNAAEDQSGPSTQFAWRVPTKISTRDERSSSIIKDDPMPKLALDRLSDTLLQTEKSLFEQVAVDLKKVAIKTTDTSAFQNTEGSLTDTALSAISSISDLGNTLGGWGWSGASKLISSASQVTSQVGSVLDSVVGLNLPEEDQQQPTQQQHPTTATSSARYKDCKKVPESSTSDGQQEKLPKGVPHAPI